MDRATAVELLDRLHEAQNAFHGGGAPDALERLLAEDVVWTVPGDNRIAGTYRGRDEVLAYFRRRREQAEGTFRMQRLDVLVGEGDTVAVLTDGSATIAGVEHHWSTVGLYDVVDGRIAACWLLPLDPREFDAIWSQGPGDR